jgi:DNA-directed RNA polymerase
VRGRAYPLPAFLNPQGPDYAKGLLEFAEAEPIEDDEQAAWLAVAGANAWGNDKVSLQERADWVIDNEAWIAEIGNDFRSNLQWMDASEPFQFLRFCIEWAGYVSACAAGLTFFSRMPCPVDATNSGLQHYSAMLRDPVGGRSVNLVPGLSRQDIYGDVAEVVMRKLDEVVDTELDVTRWEESLAEWQWAKDWLQVGVDRKMTKRQVMVVPYAGKFTSCMEYTRKGYAEKVKAGLPPIWDKKEDFERTTFLARLIWAAIDEVVVKGKEAMTWLSRIALDWAKNANKLDTDNCYDRRMTWRTPDGFEVVQWRDQSKKGQVESYLEGRVQLVHYEEGDKLDTREMALSTPPNFVHSLDATHLRMAVRRAQGIGIAHFAMVHDSFGVHARFMPEFLTHAVKPAFIQMYTDHDPLAELRERCLFPTENPPARGSLDLAGINDSEFFFS